MTNKRRCDESQAWHSKEREKDKQTQAMRKRIRPPDRNTTTVIVIGYCGCAASFE